MKKYIFITHDINTIGGMQQYTAGKIEYLKKMGWIPICICSKELYTDYNPLPTYRDVLCKNIVGLKRHPNMFRKNIREHILKDMVKTVGRYAAEDEIIIESQEDTLALWGELLAEQVGAKHVLFDCEEKFDLPSNFYLTNMDFFKFKFIRGEFAAMSKPFIYGLFDGILDVKPEDIVLFKPEHLNPVQDVDNKLVNSLEKRDWNICYLGRLNKPYVKNILTDIGKVAAHNPGKSILFFALDDSNRVSEDARNMLSSYQNLTVVFLGRISPIPRKIFSLADVVIAGAGSAVCAAYEGVPTIIADSDNFLANGVYGADTFNFFRHENTCVQMNYDQAIENVLLYNKYENGIITLPERESTDQIYAEHLSIIRQSSREKEYFTNYESFDSSKQRRNSCKYILHKYFPGIVKIWRKFKRKIGKA